MCLRSACCLCDIPDHRTRHGHLPGCALVSNWADQGALAWQQLVASAAGLLPHRNNLLPRRSNFSGIPLGLACRFPASMAAHSSPLLPCTDVKYSAMNIGGILLGLAGSVTYSAVSYIESGKAAARSAKVRGMESSGDGWAGLVWKWISEHSWSNDKAALRLLSLSTQPAQRAHIVCSPFCGHRRGNRRPTRCCLPSGMQHAPAAARAAVKSCRWQLAAGLPCSVRARFPLEKATSGRFAQACDGIDGPQ